MELELKDLIGAEASLTDVFIGVMGVTGAGKTSFISKCMQKVDAEPEVTNTAIGTSSIIVQSTQINGRTVHLIDTPGLNSPHRSDGETLQELLLWLLAAHKLGMRLSGMIYLHPIIENRLSGSARRALTIFKKMVGEEAYKGVILACSLWNLQENSAVARQRQAELCGTAEFWGELINAGAETEKLDNSSAAALKIVEGIMGKKGTFELLIQRQIVKDRLPPYQTDAGKLVSEFLVADMKSLDRDMEIVEETFKTAIDEQYDQSKEDLSVQKADLGRRYDSLASSLEDLEKSPKVWIIDQGRRFQSELEELGLGELKIDPEVGQMPESEQLRYLRELQNRLREVKFPETTGSDDIAMKEAARDKLLEKTYRAQKRAVRVNIAGAVGGMISLVIALVGVLSG